MEGSSNLQAEKTSETKTSHKFTSVLRTVSYNLGLVTFFLLFILSFVFSLNLLTKGIHILSTTSTHKLFEVEANRSFYTLGLIIGEASTALSQSQSVSTSIAVSMVAANAITVTTAIPVVMGANIGTSITTTLITGAMYSGDSTSYRRAFAAAVLSDVTNIMTIFVVFPLEFLTHALEKLTREIVDYDLHHHNRYHEGMKNAKALMKEQDDNFNMVYLVQPLMHRIIQLNDYDQIELTGKALRSCEVWNSERLVVTEGHKSKKKVCSYFFQDWYKTGNDVGIGLILCFSALALLGIVLAMFAAVTNKASRSPMEQGIQAFRARAGSKQDRSWVKAILSGIVFGLFGLVMRSFVQSSLVFVAIISSLCAGQYISFPNTYALVLGGNIGATTTTLLAALSQKSNEINCVLQVFLFHLFFTLISVLLYSLPGLQFPLYISKVLGEKAAVYKWFPYFYLFCLFFITPALTVLLYLIHPNLFITVAALIAFFMFVVFVIIKLQEFRNGTLLPRVLTTWNFLPLWMHSLDPLDDAIKKCVCVRRKGKVFKDHAKAQFNKEKELVDVDVKESDIEEI